MDPGFRIDLDYSAFFEAERLYLGVRLFQIVEVLHDLVVVHAEVQVVQCNRLLLLVGQRRGRGGGGGGGGRGGRGGGGGG